VHGGTRKRYTDTEKERERKGGKGRRGTAAETVNVGRALVAAEQCSNEREITTGTGRAPISN